MDDARITVRGARADDLPAIATIQEQSPEAAQWDPASYLDHNCLVACLDWRIVGFLVTRQVAPDEREILTLAVDPGDRQKGIARTLLKHALENTKGAWFLEVRASNLAAIRLYKSAGFEAAGRRSEYYYEPAEDGIVMRFFS